MVEAEVEAATSSRSPRPSMRRPQSAPDEVVAVAVAPPRRSKPVKAEAKPKAEKAAKADKAAAKADKTAARAEAKTVAEAKTADEPQGGRPKPTRADADRPAMRNPATVRVESPADRRRLDDAAIRAEPVEAVRESRGVRLGSRRHRLVPDRRAAGPGAGDRHLGPVPAGRLTRSGAEPYHPRAPRTSCGMVLRADVAQLVEQRFCKPPVPGSSPVVGSNANNARSRSTAGRSSIGDVSMGRLSRW